MDFTFGLIGKGYVMLAIDTNATYSIMKLKNDVDKTKILGPHLAMTYCGDPGDSVKFSDLIQRNMRLYEISSNQELRPQAAAAFVRNILSTAIRSRRGPYGVLTLLGGFDVSSAAIKGGHEEEGGEPHLYWLDYYGTMTEVPFAAHGHASYFVLSILDKYHDPNGSVDDGISVLRRCMNEIQKRHIAAPTKYKVKIIDKDGVREIELQ